MRFIGITGGVGAGKSKVLKLLEKLCNCRIMEADRIAEKMTLPGGLAYDKLISTFENDDIWMLQDGEKVLDRPKTAQVIFSNEEKRKQFNRIVHPAVKSYILRESEIERIMDAHDFLILEAALLIEEGYDRVCEELWYIYTPEEVRRARLRESRGYSDEKIDSIFASQLSEERFREACVRVIDNTGSEDALEETLKSILAQYICEY